MIKIEITTIKTVEWEEEENKIVERTPTEITDPNSTSYDRDKKLYAEKYAIAKVKKRQDVRKTLLAQEIDDAGFDIKKVIAAINGMTSWE